MGVGRYLLGGLGFGGLGGLRLLRLDGLRLLLGLARFRFGLGVVLHDRVDGQPLARSRLVPANAIFLGPGSIWISAPRSCALK